MTVHLDRGADVASARWLCHGCGATYPLGGPAYPICECGQRCRMVDADGLPFVGSPEARVAAARALHEKAYAEWRLWRGELRRSLDRLVGETATEAELSDRRWWGGPLPSWDWRRAGAAAIYANWTAEHVERVAADVARLTEASRAAAEVAEDGA